MNLKRIAAYEVYAIASPDPYNEIVTFTSLNSAMKYVKQYGGKIRNSSVFVKE